MRCARCSGEMAYEYFHDMDDDTGNLFFNGWRCVICGDILDPLIVSNREKRPAPFINRNKKLIVSSRS